MWRSFSLAPNNNYSFFFFAFNPFSTYRFTAIYFQFEFDSSTNTIKRMKTELIPMKEFKMAMWVVFGFLEQGKRDDQYSKAIGI